jgi:hypothetical protein
MSEFLKGLFRIAVWAITLGLAYWGATAATKHLTGKHIHEHALDCLSPEFKNKIAEWYSNAIESGGVHLRLLKDDGSVQGKRVLRAIGLWKKPNRVPVTITEEVITLEQAREMGFDLSLTSDQELAYMVA